jgi:hypothetical protein
MGSVRGAASAPISMERRASAGAGSVGAASDSAGSASQPLIGGGTLPSCALTGGHLLWAPTGERRVLIRSGHRWRSERPSGAVIRGRPYPIAGAHRPATGAHRRVVAVHSRQSFGGGIGAAPRRRDRCLCGSIFGIAVCANRDCSWGLRLAVIGGAHRRRPPPSYAFFRGGGPSWHSERGEEIDPGDEVADGQTAHFIQKDFE